VGSMRKHFFFKRLTHMLACAVLMLPGAVRAAEPGVDVSVPRFAISSVDGATFMFHPARLVVEQGDWVRWTWTGGGHSTTSGSTCVADGLWDASLNTLSPGPFTRQFLDVPGAFPFFCRPHCLSFGMTGQVEVTTLIQVSADNPGGTLKLGWT